MKYELAKRLKDAGFKHDHTHDCYFQIGSIGDDNVCDGISLSELIEACGDGLDALFNSTKYPSKNKWQAVRAIGAGWEETHFGPTPEEAVANLWLSLIKKKP